MKIVANEGNRVLQSIPDSDDGAKYLLRAGALLAGPRMVELPKCERPDRYAYWNPHDGKITVETASPPALKIIAGSPQDLVDILIDQGHMDTRVFVSLEGVRAVLHIEERDEQVLLPLTPTDAYAALRSGWRGDQAALINVLRNQFAKLEKTGLLAVARTVRLTKGSDTTMVANHGSASVSAEVQRKALLNGTDLPEYAEFELNLFEELADAQYMHPVRAIFDVDIERAIFSLTPVAAELLVAEVETVRTLAEFIRNGLRGHDEATEIKVFCGTLG